MRAITCSGYGRPTEVLHPTEVETPTLAPEAVLVGVRAASLNPADWHLVRGIPYVARLQVGVRRPPFSVPGSDLAGVVEAVGSAVTTVRPGDEVFGTTFMAGFGAFAEQAAVPERLLAHKPARASFEEAAGLPLAASTALQALRDHGGVQAGQRVLVIGASGGVGSCAVQLAAHLGASVTGVCSTRNVELVRSLGAARVIDHTADDLTAIDARFDVVLQAGGAHSAGELRHLLTETGTLVQLSGDSPNRWLGPVGRVLRGRLLSSVVRQAIVTFTVQPNRDDLSLLADLVAEGALRTVLDRTYDLREVAEGLERIEAGHTRGKAVVRIAPQGTSWP